MKVKIIKTGEVKVCGDEYAVRLIEQGIAVKFDEEVKGGDKSEKSVKKA